MNCTSFRVLEKALKSGISFRQGAHQVASAAAYKHQFFSESLFVRMQVLQMAGVWKGQPFQFDNASPLGAAAALDTAPVVDTPRLELSHV